MYLTIDFTFMVLAFNDIHAIGDGVKSRKYVFESWYNAICRAEVADACDNIHAHRSTRETTYEKIISNCSLIDTFNLHTFAMKQRRKMCEERIFASRSKLGSVMLDF